MTRENPRYPELLSQVAPATGTNGHHEVRMGSQVLASGDVLLDGFNPVSITVDPVAQTVGVALKGVDLGTRAARVSPSFIAFEGQGWADDLFVRTVPWMRSGFPRGGGPRTGDALKAVPPGHVPES